MKRFKTKQEFNSDPINWTEKMNVYFGVPWDKEGVHDPHNLIGDTRYIAPQHLIDAPHPYEGKRFVIVLEEDCSTELLQKKCFALDYAWNNGSKYLIDLSKHDYILLEENHMMVGSAEFLQREHQQTPKLSIQEFMDGDRLPNFPIGGRISGRHADKMMEESLKYKELLLQSQEEKDQKDVQFQVEQAELQLQSDTLATKQSLAEAKADLVASKARCPFNASEVISAQADVEALEDGLKRLVALKEELF